MAKNEKEPVIFQAHGEKGYEAGELAWFEHDKCVELANTQAIGPTGERVKLARFASPAEVTAMQGAVEPKTSRPGPQKTVRFLEYVGDLGACAGDTMTLDAAVADRVVTEFRAGVFVGAPKKKTGTIKNKTVEK